jgi:IS30 family transposase
MGKTYQQLSLEERIEVQVQRERGLSTRAIARVLKRAASTVSRELRRNGSKPVERKAGPDRPPKPVLYSASEAHGRALRLARKPRVKPKLAAGTTAWAAVLEQFAAGLSPEQAARTLKRMHPENRQLHFSHETIYQAIYAMPRGELRAEVVALLRFGHAKPGSPATAVRRWGGSAVPAPGERIAEARSRTSSASTTGLQKSPKSSSPATGRATPSRAGITVPPSAPWSSARPSS